MNLIKTLFCPLLIKVTEPSNPITELAHALHRTFWQQCCVNISLYYAVHCYVTAVN